MMNAIRKLSCKWENLAMMLHLKIEFFLCPDNLFIETKFYWGKYTETIFQVNRCYIGGLFTFYPSKLPKPILYAFH